MHYFVYLTRDLFTVYVTAPWLGTTDTYAISQSKTPWSWQSSAKKVFLRDPLLPYSKAWCPRQQPSFPCTSAPSISSRFSLPCLHVPVGRARMQFPSLLLVKWGRNPASSARTPLLPSPVGATRCSWSVCSLSSHRPPYLDRHFRMTSSWDQKISSGGDQVSARLRSTQCRYVKHRGCCWKCTWPVCRSIYGALAILQEPLPFLRIAAFTVYQAQF